MALTVPRAHKSVPPVPFCIVLSFNSEEPLNSTLFQCPLFGDVCDKTGQ